jgi:hypothetical protein
VLYVRDIVRKIEGRFRLAFAHWGIALPPEHVRERGKYKEYFSSLSLPRLQFLAAPENLCLEPGHIQVRPQGLLGRPHLKLCDSARALQKPRSVLWFSPRTSTL